MSDEQSKIPEGEIYDLPPLPDGANIHSVAVAACVIAMLRGTMVRFQFNIATIIIEPGVPPEEVVKQYHALMYEHKDEILKSGPYKAFKALHEAEKTQRN